MPKHLRAAVLRSTNGSTVMMPILAIAFLPADKRIELEEAIPFHSIKTYRQELNCLALNIAHEGSVLTRVGQASIGHVTRNRVESPLFPNTFCGVVKQGGVKLHACQFTWHCDEQPDYTLEEVVRFSPESVEVARDILAERNLGSIDFTDGALFYYAALLDEDRERWPESWKSYSGPPKWRDRMEKTAEIDGHKFFRLVPTPYSRPPKKLVAQTS